MPIYRPEAISKADMDNAFNAFASSINQPQPQGMFTTIGDPRPAMQPVVIPNPVNFMISRILELRAQVKEELFRHRRDIKTFKQFESMSMSATIVSQLLDPRAYSFVSSCTMADFKTILEAEERDLVIMMDYLDALIANLESPDNDTTADDEPTEN